ncbi:MAG: glycosyltransferase family 2 protein [Pseudomonadota bacterium]
MANRVSFIVTVYNKAEFLPQVIEGLRRQQGDFDREFIFVDDGSTDGSPELIRRLGGDLPNLAVIEQPNGGPARAMNVGLRAAAGDWIKGLDGDDILLPNATQLLLRACRQGGRGLAYGAPVAVGALAPYDRMLEAVEGWRTDEPRIVARFDDHLPHSLQQSRMNPSCWLAARDLVTAAGGADERVFIQDYSLELRMAAQGRPFVQLANPIFLWRQETEGRVSGNKRQILHDCNLAVAYLFIDRPDLFARYGRLAALRTLGRAWHWSRRHEGCGVVSGAFLRRAKAYLRLASVADIEASCADFGEPVRRPPLNAPAAP